MEVHKCKNMLSTVIESAIEDALNVGSLKINVREQIKTIQSAFEGFIP